MATQKHRQPSLFRGFSSLLAAVFPRARIALYPPAPTPPHILDCDAPTPHRAQVIPFPAPSPAQVASTARARAPIPFLVTRKSLSPSDVPSLVLILPQAGIR
jgi:hypothetical protein